MGVKAIIGRKVGMTQIINEDGRVRAVTLISATPNVISQIKTEEVDGYQSYQIGFETARHPAKAQLGHAAKQAKTKTAPKVVQEVRVDSTEGIEAGSTVDVTAFEVGENVQVTGTSKGKGFAGTIKRHNFMRSRKTHGGKGDVRKPGSIGSMYPQHVLKGKRMAGQMGHDRVTVKNLEIAIIDPELNVIGVVGAVPGPKKSLVTIKGASA